MLQAWRMASRRAIQGIIRFHWRQWVHLPSAPGFWLGGGMGVVIMAGSRSPDEAVAILALGLVLFVLACIDSRTGLLPDALTQPVMWAGLALAWLSGDAMLAHAFAGVTVGYAVPSVMRLLWSWWRQREALGYGDVKLLAGIGAWVGPLDVLHVLLLACISAIIWAGCRYRGLLLHGTYPFGPFLSCSAMAWLAWSAR